MMVIGRKRFPSLSHLILSVAILCTSSYLLAHTVNAWVTESLTNPANPISAPKVPVAQDDYDNSLMQDRYQQYAQDILTSRLFSLAPSNSQRSQARGLEASSPRPLNLSSKVALVGIVLGSGGSQRAVLEELPHGRQALYRVSQEIPGLGEVAAIEKGRVLVRSGMQEEWLDLTIVKPSVPVEKKPVAPVIPLPPDRRILDRRQVAQVLSRPESYLTEASFQPYLNRSGKLEGFALDAIRPVGVLDNAGLQEDDILSGVNGIEIHDPGKLWDAFRETRQERFVRLNVMRQGQPVTLAVEIR